VQPGYPVVDQYGLLELVVQLDDPPMNPFSVNSTTAAMVVLQSSGLTGIIVPFWFQNFSRSQAADGTELLTSVRAPLSHTTHTHTTHTHTHTHTFTRTHGIHRERFPQPSPSAHAHHQLLDVVISVLHSWEDRRPTLPPSVHASETWTAHIFAPRLPAAWRQPKWYVSSCRGCAPPCVRSRLGRWAIFCCRQ
jgi:hypothetical protein